MNRAIPATVLALRLFTHNAFAEGVTALHHFTGGDDGTGPRAAVVVSGDMIYGTAYAGGSGAWGTVFKVRIDGSSFTTLHSFTNVPDGAYSRAGLVLSGNMLFGTTEHGGISNNGTIFKVDTNGTGFVTLHSFTNSVDGANPYGGLVLSGDTLFGTAYFGGSNHYGTVFKLDTNGDNFTPLHDFTYYDSDGANPAATLALSGNTLYGTAHGGGDWGYGTVFKLNIDGSGFAPILSFRYTDNGGWPFSGVVVSGNTVYGTTSSGGGQGTVFKVNINGTGYTKLHAFAGGNEGSNPQAGLVLIGSGLYGTTYWGGEGSHGTIFRVDTAGTNLVTVHSFEYGEYNNLTYITNSSGVEPYAGLALSGNTLYGTTSRGGTNGWGTLFRLTVPPAFTTLSLQPVSNAVVLSWLDPSFCLQTAPSVNGVYTNIPGATTPYTNATTGPQMFFRLQAN